MKVCFLNLFLFVFFSLAFGQELPSRKEQYTFAAQFIHGTDSTHLLLNKKSATRAIYEDSSSFLSDTTHFSVADFDYFRLQLKEIRNLKWNANRFEKVRTISQLRTRWIFRDRKGWRRFHRKFPKECLTSCSVPLFNVSGTYCIMYTGTQCGGLIGGGSTDLYRLEDGKWVFVESYGMWIS